MPPVFVKITDPADETSGHQTRDYLQEEEVRRQKKSVIKK